MKSIFIALSFLALAGCSRPANEEVRMRIEKPTVHSKQVSVVYPYSVVPGGVDTREDVQRAMLGDAVAGSHYSGIDTSTLRSAVLDRDTRAYVSYRKNGAVYWTRTAVLLTKGEKILTNGRDCLRGRCGNRVSLTPQKPVIGEADREPLPAVFNTPQTASGTVLDEVVPNLAVAGLSVQQSIEFPAVAPPAAKASTAPLVAGVLPPGAAPWEPGPPLAEGSSGVTPPPYSFPLPSQPPGALPSLIFERPPVAAYDLGITPLGLPAPDFTGTIALPTAPPLYPTVISFRNPDVTSPPSFLAPGPTFAPGPPPTGIEVTVPPPPVVVIPPDGGPPHIEVFPPLKTVPPDDQASCCAGVTPPTVPPALQPVPEPSALVLLAAGLASLPYAARRTSRA